MKKFGKSLIVFGMPAVGKTYFCQNNSNCIDLESSRYQWLDRSVIAEEGKGTSQVKNPAWPQNYYDAIRESLGKYDFVFVAYQGMVFANENGYDYAIIYPEKDAKEEYRKRMLARKNPEIFVDKICKNWDNMVQGCEEDNSKNLVLKIKLNKNQYLADAIPQLESALTSFNHTIEL